MRLLLNYEEDFYLDTLSDLTEDLEKEQHRNDRTGVGCVSRFGDQMKYDLSNDTFPLLTTKRVYWKGVFHELAWFLRGATNTEYLVENGVHIWDEWALSEEDVDGRHPLFGRAGDLGPVYGAMWRSWPVTQYSGLPIDQLAEVIWEIQNNPNSRRLLVSSWNPEFLPNNKLSPQENVLLGNQALPPCHCLFQFFVKDGKLSCQLYQRSADIFLGVPFNIASYALLTKIIANICDLEPGEFIHTFGDLHLYSNHYKPALTQLEREPKAFPKLIISKKLTIDDLVDLNIEDFDLVGYDPAGSISAPIAV